MSDVTGVKIADLTECGSSDDGEHVWITHRLGDGSEYPLVYPYQAVGYLITVLTDAARSAYRRRAARNPQEAVQGMDSDIIPIDEVRVGTAPDKSGAILHLTTGDGIPIAVQIPVPLLANLGGEVARVLRTVGPAAGKRLH
jgi:hypothetical protein